MISSLPINEHYQTYSCWLAARRGQARIHALNSQTAALAITCHNPQLARWHRPAHPAGILKISLRPPPPQLASTAGVPKSP